MADEVMESDSDIRDQVIKRIKVQLVWRDWSQVQLAQAAEMRQAYLSRRMTGEITFDLHDLDRIAEALGVTVRELLPDDGEEAPRSPAAPVEPRVVATAGGRRRSRGLTRG